MCYIDRQLEATSISDFMTFSYVCGLKVLILVGLYPSVASSHRCQVVRSFVCLFFVVVVFCFLFVCLFFFWGGGGGSGDETSGYLVQKF